MPYPLTIACRSALVATALLCSAFGSARGQNPLTQLGLTEMRAHELTHQVVVGGSQANGVDQAIKKTFLALPGPARGAATTAMWVWTKNYVNSPAFKAVYAKARTEATPEPRTFQGTVDAALTAKMDEQVKSLAESRKSIQAMPADQRAAMEAVLRQQETMLQSGDYKNMMKMAIEMERVQARANDSSEMKRWRDEYPTDPQVLIARRLRAFLAMCTDVDYAAKTEILDGQRVFSSTAYERKSSEWKQCFRAGPEAMTAARTAATAWLKQIAP